MSMVFLWTLSLDADPTIMFLLYDGGSVRICVRYGIADVLSGDNIAPPLTGKCDLPLYIIHVLLVLDSKRASDAG